MFAITPNILSNFMISLSRYVILLSLVLISVSIFLIIFLENDYYQGISFKIMFIHVPTAWLSLAIFLVMGISSIVGLIFKSPTAFTVARSLSPIGLIMSIIVLVTGSIWGNLTWGAYWVWDARLTSELILLFLYLGYMALQSAFENKRIAARAGAILALIGVINIPIIHYSVEWWSTLHQGPTITKLDKPSIHITMLIPLIFMVLAFKTFYIMTALIRARSEILEYEYNSSWAKKILGN